MPMNTTIATWNVKMIFVLLVLTISLPSRTFGQKRVLYKEVDTTQLYMDIYRPADWQKGGKYPAIVFFFGGGWVRGDRNQFEPTARYLVQRGMVCFLVDYRVRTRHGTTPFEALSDARSAMRFVRMYAPRFAVDPMKIVAAGGSAGGQLAAATALVDGYNEVGEDTAVDVRPNALVLFNPVIDNGPGGYGYDRIGEAFPSFSPLHNIRDGAPPTIIFLGTEDWHVPVATAQYYKQVMEKVGSRCDLHLYEGQKHGFYTYKNFEYHKKTLQEADRFLVSLGYLQDQPIVEVE